MEGNMPKKNRQELLALVYSSEAELAKAAALMWTVENLGQSWPEVSSYSQLLEMHMDGTGGDPVLEEEMEEGLREEFDHWLKHAKELLKEVVRRELPLTLGSMELAFHGGLS
jgi:hypothetical protein